MSEWPASKRKLGSRRTCQAELGFRMSWVHRGESVRIQETPVGKGVFAERSYPVGAVIGEITGDVIRYSDGSDYSFEIDEETQLEPYPPFRYLNHSCEPNCEFDWIEDPICDDELVLFVIALRDVHSGEELTIDYNWPVSCAIPCRCGSRTCRGWIVSRDEVDSLDSLRDQRRKNFAQTGDGTSSL